MLREKGVPPRWFSFRSIIQYENQCTSWLTGFAERDNFGRVQLDDIVAPVLQILDFSIQQYQAIESVIGHLK